MSIFVTAKLMAESVGIGPKTYRRALRNEKFSWHEYYARWMVPVDSLAHEDMKRVLASLRARGRSK